MVETPRVDSPSLPRKSRLEPNRQRQDETIHFVYHSQLLIFHGDEQPALKTSGGGGEKQPGDVARKRIFCEVLILLSHDDVYSIHDASDGGEEKAI